MSIAPASQVLPAAARHPPSSARLNLTVSLILQETLASSKRIKSFRPLLRKFSMHVPK